MMYASRRSRGKNAREDEKVEKIRNPIRRRERSVMFIH